MYRVPVLEGRVVRLEPLEERHVPDLAEAADADRASYGFTTVPQGPDGTATYVAAVLAAVASGDTVGFAQVRQSDGRAVGVTRYLTFRHAPEVGGLYAVEVGGTWLGAAAQRTGINVEAKLLLFGHAFEQWSVGRVDLKTDARNERSRAAIAALGATFEGVLHQWQPSHAVGETGMLRDTAMFSVVTGRWPDVRAELERRLDRH
ncbi:MAG TPA: GNAT family protein [Acidimicrobiales bacterium]|nr:GNAT family protein [Acidimicrobiales bacterium]